MPTMPDHDFGPSNPIPAGHGSTSVCGACGATRMVYETGETVWLDIDKSELPAKVGYHLEQQCPGRSARLRDLYGVGRPAVVSAEAVAPSASRPDSGTRILIVDDDLDGRAALAEIFELRGYAVDCAGNGRLALEHLRNAQTLPSVIILDVLMPEMDGWQFRAEQKNDPRLAGIPVVVVTAMRNTEEFDAAAVLHKPVRVQVLLAAVAHLCSGGEAN